MGRASVTRVGEYTKRLWLRTVRREFIDEQKSALTNAKSSDAETGREFLLCKDTVTRLIEENERLRHEVTRLQLIHREQHGPLQQS
jgi:hypothetical protein